MRKSFNIIMIVLLISLILFEEILILPDVEAHGNCWTLYDYTFYLNIAILVLFIPAVFVHFDILFDACFGGCPGVPTEPTED
ncbi:hypothetical protein NPIL_125861 [Nephila pilipes]|uniref:Uncharacterized protein n=1 Tax=Nephila pilipes TaxID=299642 RepID=A0A8X6PI44_NEPPI|nr:hypothetical protein NPIL_125861 [Nephila pilipes]